MRVNIDQNQISGEQLAYKHYIGADSGLEKKINSKILISCINNIILHKSHPLVSVTSFIHDQLFHFFKAALIYLLFYFTTERYSQSSSSSLSLHLLLNKNPYKFVITQQLPKHLPLLLSISFT